MRTVRAIVAIYVGIVILLYAFQTRAIFPGAETQGQRSAQVRTPSGTELVTLETVQGERIVALFGPALDAAGQPERGELKVPTMIFFYGNGNCLNDTVALFDRFRRHGVNVIVPDYVGYGMSAGKPSEKGCQATADTVYDYLVMTRKIDPGTIISAGWSLGGAVAIDLAARRQVGGLIAFSTFTSLVEMGRRVVPFVPVSLLLKHRFDSLRKIAMIDVPTLIGHGRRDTIVPFRMGETLAASAGGPVATLWIDQAEHNNFFDVGHRQIEAGMTTYLAKYFGVRR